MIDLSTELSKCINLSTNLSHIILESNRTTCVHCSEMLHRVARYTPNSKGSISIVYHNTKGPIIAVTFRKDCNICKSSYFYGYFDDNRGNRVYEDLKNLEYFQLSQSTLFHRSIFREYKNWAFEDGVGGQSFVSKYNRRFETQINSIPSTELGRRKKSGVKLETNRFLESFRLHEMVRLLQEQNHTFRVPHEISRQQWTEKDTVGDS